MKVNLDFLLVFSLINTKISFANDDVDPKDSTSAFGELCDSTGPFCNAEKNLKCVDGNCGCKSSLYTHIDDEEDCLLIAQSSNTICKYDEQCTESTFGKNSFCLKEKFSNTGKCECREFKGDCKIPKQIGEACGSDSECKTVVLGDVVCLGSNEAENKKGICQCAERYHYDVILKKCLRLGTINSKCETDRQCQHENALGPLSRCRNETHTCTCWDVLGNNEKRAEFSGGRCHYSRDANETCTEKVECELGYHKDADCMIHPSFNNEKVCQCPPNYTCGDAASTFTASLIIIVLSLAYYISSR